MTTKFNCKNCRKEFLRNHNQTYCSEECRKEGRRLSVNKYNKSDKKKIVDAKYRKSEKGKISIKKFIETGYYKEYEKKYYLDNSEKIKKRSRIRYSEKKDIIKEQQKKYYYSLTPEKKLKKNKLNRIWKKTPQGKASGRYDASMRRKAIKQATPIWNDDEKTKYIYNIAVKLEKLFKAPVHVDHIVPLKGITFEDNAKVCGLNVYYNLMPVLETDNESKKNYCPPSKQIKEIKIPHLSLDKLPKPKHWVKFINLMYKRALEFKKGNTKLEEFNKSYIEVNPRKLKNKYDH